MEGNIIKKISTSISFLKYLGMQEKGLELRELSPELSPEKSLQFIARRGAEAMLALLDF